MSTSYYYTGTDYSSMHPWHYDFWIALFDSWSFLNTAWVVLLFLYIWVKWNDAVIYNKRDDQMTEVGWWFVALFFVIVLLFYAIGFWAGKNWERTTWEDKKLVAPKKKVKR